MKSTCPNISDLARLLQGEVTGPEADVMEQHLSACPACACRAAELHSADTLVDDRLRRVETFTETDDPLVQDIVDRLGGIPVWLIDRHAVAEDRPRVNDQAGVSVSIRSLLTPPCEPGDLGRLGKYRVVGLLGSGATGIVFDAVDTDLHRPVALKILRPENLADSGTARSRFRREAILAASVRHENIVTIHDVGEVGDRCFLAFERLWGESLQARLGRTGRLPVPTSLRVIEQVLLALNAIHQHGLIHRDIKPANIWLVDEPSLVDSTAPRLTEPRVKILDFGLARSSQADVALTLEGTFMGTPGYWSPEQANGRTVDSRSDLFSVGCVLYRMVSGQLPFGGSDLLEYFVSLATKIPESLRSYDSRILAELDHFTTRLLAKDAQDRFSTAKEALDALQKLTSACIADANAADGANPCLEQVNITDEKTLPGSHVMRSAVDLAEPTATRRSVRRGGPPLFWLLILATILFVSLAAVFRVTTEHGTIEVVSSSDDIELEIRSPEGKPRIVMIDRHSEFEISLTPGEYELRARVKDGLEFSTSKPIRIIRGGKEVVRVNYLLGRASERPQSNASAQQVKGANSPGNQWFELREACSLGGEFLRHWNSIVSLAVSPSEARLLTGGADGLARLWDLSAQSMIAELNAHSLKVSAVAIHPRDNLLATAGEDGLLKLWQPSGDSPRAYRLHRTLTLAGPIHTVRFSFDGDMLAVMTRSFVRLYDADTLELAREIPCSLNDDGLADGLAFFHRDSRMVIRGDHRVFVIDAITGEEVSSVDLGQGTPTVVAVSMDDLRVGVGLASPDSAIVVINTETGEIVRRLEAPTRDNEPLALQFSPDQQHVMAVFGRPFDSRDADPDGTNCILQWHLNRSEEPTTIKAPIFNSGFVSAAYLDAGRRIVGVSRDVWGTIWDSRTGRRIAVDEPAPFFSCTAAPGSKLVAGGAADGRIHLFDATDLREVRVIAGHESQVFDLAVNAHGERLLSSGTDNTVRMWDTTSRENLWASKHWAPGVQWIGESGLVVAGGHWYECFPQLFSAADGRAATQPDSWSNSPYTCIAATHGSVVATGQAAGPVKLWDLNSFRQTGSLLADHITSVSGANALAFSPDGARLAVAYDATEKHRGHIVLWDVRTQQLLSSQSAYTGRVMSLEFDPSGTTVAAGTFDDCSVRIWMVPSLQLGGSLRIGPTQGGVLKLAYFDEGRRLAALGSDGRIHVVTTELAP